MIYGLHSLTIIDWPNGNLGNLWSSHQIYSLPCITHSLHGLEPCSQILQRHVSPSPKSIIYERDPLFINTFWCNLFKAWESTLEFSSSYHPQTDGQIEVLNIWWEAYLRCFTSDHPHSWYQYLHLAELWYNISYHSAIGTSPFRAFYSQPPPTTLDILHTPWIETKISYLLCQHTLVIHTTQTCPLDRRSNLSGWKIV